MSLLFFGTSPGLSVSSSTIRSDRRIGLVAPIALVALVALSCTRRRRHRPRGHLGCGDVGRGRKAGAGHVAAAGRPRVSQLYRNREKWCGKRRKMYLQYWFETHSL